MSHSELELRIQWLDRGEYFIGGRYIDPETDRETDLIEPVRIGIDLAELQRHALDPQAYGAALTEMVFGGPDSRIHQAFTRARAYAANRDGLRIRLHVQASAPELHAVHWELMREPGKTTPLLFNTSLWFCRFLSSDDFLLRPLSDPDNVQMLAVVANPSDLASRWQQAPIDAQQELRRTQEAIDAEAWHGPRKVTLRALDGRASLYNIVSSLRDRYSDILYLACHGTITPDGAPRLLLENDEGLGDVVRGEELVQRIAAADERPRLIILASCRGAGGQGDQALAALAPRLLLAGVPNVLAMQGDVSVKSVERFMRRFFRELVKDGQIDRAVAIARADIHEQHDWWMPVLYTQSKSGVVWPPRGTDAGAFEHWEAVVSNVANQKCVPVLGPGLVEPVIGPSREIARAWAERYEFPLAPNQRDDLAQVAQHLAYQNGPSFVVDAMRSYVVGYLRRNYSHVLPPELMAAPVKQGMVDSMVSHIGKDLRDSDPGEVHTLLAQLPLPIYVNANRDNLLYDALVEEGKKPRILLCAWRSSGDQSIEYGPQLDASYTPSETEPLILHVFGNYQYPESLVITEDDYFEFLMGVTRNETRGMNGIPRAVTAAIASSGLLLLGFRVEDWDFRTVLGSILRQPGRVLQWRRTSVAIQMTPSDEHAVPERMFKYLRRYFHDQSNINLFWSSPQEFLAQLVDRFQRDRAA
ncbi:CHAT domain-containing protein [Lysobacter sp. CA199]|uniref:CHAT domain-containing protein n=1 Tax=Lysobacter sp. CA199 TaxID=3455608 RepID=UPI003F8D203D